MKALIEHLDKINLLLLHVFLECVSDEVDVFSLALLFSISILSTARGSALCLVKGLFLFELIKTLAVIIRGQIWSKGCFRIAKGAPVESFEKWVSLDFLDTC